MWYIAAIGVIGVLVSAAAFMINVGLMLLSAIAFGIIAAIMLLYSKQTPARMARAHAGLTAAAEAWARSPLKTRASSFIAHVSEKAGRHMDTRGLG